MKKLLALLLCLVLLLTLAACDSGGGGGGGGDDAEDYAEDAQALIDEGDIEGAIALLEEGIEETDDEALKEMLAGLQGSGPAVCPECEAELAEGTKFCPDCGAAAPEPAPAAPLTNCPDCDAELSEGAKFCTECGASIPAPAAPLTNCPDCGAELSEGAKFCTECGADTTAAASAAANLDIPVIESVTAQRAFVTDSSSYVGFSLEEYDAPEGALSLVTKDFDGDGTEETWAAEYRGNRLYFSIYRDGDSKPASSACVSEFSLNDGILMDHKLEVFMNEHDGKNLLFVCQYIEGGLVSDGVELYLSVYTIENGEPTLYRSVSAFASYYTAPEYADANNTIMKECGLLPLHDPSGSTNCDIVGTNNLEVLGYMRQYYPSSNFDYNNPTSSDPMEVDIFSSAAS